LTNEHPAPAPVAAPESPAAVPTPAAEPPADSAPPWGDDFDAARAWTTITNLREVEKRVTTERNDAQAAAQTAAEERDALRRELWTERAMRTHRLPAESLRFLFGDTEEAVMEAAAALAGMRTTPPAHDDDGGTSQHSRPAPALVPGHGGSTLTRFDPAAIARRARVQ